MDALLECIQQIKQELGQFIIQDLSNDPMVLGKISLIDLFQLLNRFQ